MHGSIALPSRSWPCGHPRTADNTQSVGSAGVRCRECRRVISRNHETRKRLAAAMAPAPSTPTPAPRPAPSQPDMFPETFR